MRSPQCAAIVVSTKGGIGDELSCVGAVLHGLLRDGWRVAIYTFHAHLYSHRALSVIDWATVPPDGWALPEVDQGICIYSVKSGLSFDFDRASVVVAPCRDAGWIMVNERFSSFVPRPQRMYEAGSRLAEHVGVGHSAPPYAFLEREPNGLTLLNLFGGGDVRKGMDAAAGWHVAYAVARRVPTRSFEIIRLQHQPLPPDALGEAPSNLRIRDARYGDPSITQLYAGAGRIVTVEGGGYHLAYVADIPALLVTSRTWFDKVASYALPPCDHRIVWFANEADQHWRVADGIAQWLEA